MGEYEIGFPSLLSFLFTFSAGISTEHKFLMDQWLSAIGMKVSQVVKRANWLLL